MGYYDLSKEERQKLAYETEEDIMQAILASNDWYKQGNEIFIPIHIINYASDTDTYIRKNAYLAIGRIYFSKTNLKEIIVLILNQMLRNSNEKVRQTSVYALGEIGKKDFEGIKNVFEYALKDKHHSVRNAVIGSIKQMGQKNPDPTFEFAKKYLHDSDPKIRIMMVHGIELRGRTHPQDVLPLLEELQNDEAGPVRKMLIHVIGQISYKKGCLEKVIDAFNSWKNMDLVHDAVIEILNVHQRYKFSARSPENAEKYIKENLQENNSIGRILWTKKS